ncbi:uncharacterized protein LOC135929834 [Gordionus sp. m RMFG-2023]|uniref:uncharacterized protein LOC135929834 n=1 Tax=Gordionus sp. m RMFG-2023 TaxID=3053472 RepID=UPI0031FD2250
MVFFNLEKAFARIPRKLTWWELRYKKVPVKYIKIIQDMYMGHTKMVGSTTGTSRLHNSQGIYQGSALSPLLFITIIDVQTVLGIYLQMILWKDEMKERLVSWINILKKQGLKVNRSKTEYMVIGGDETENIDTNEWQILAIENCKYLGSFIQTKEIKSKINQGWLKWRSLSAL